MIERSYVGSLLEHSRRIQTRSKNLLRHLSLASKTLLVLSTSNQRFSTLRCRQLQVCSLARRFTVCQRTNLLNLEMPSTMLHMSPRCVSFSPTFALHTLRESSSSLAIPAFGMRTYLFSVPWITRKSVVPRKHRPNIRLSSSYFRAPKLYACP